MSERILRHANGGALKIGTEVHVSQDSFCADSRIYGNSAVISSTLTGSMVENAQVFNSTLRASHAIGSVVAESALSLICAVGCIIHKVSGSGYPTSQMRLKGVVVENCQIYGNWTLEGNARIHEGIWTRSPRFCHITGDNGVSFGLTECRPGYAMLGCWCKPLKELLKAGPRLGRKHGWDPSQIQAAKEFYEMLADVPLEGVSLKETRTEKLKCLQNSAQK